MEDPLADLLKNERLLRVHELRCLHGIPLLSSQESLAENPIFKRSSFQGAAQRRR